MEKEQIYIIFDRAYKEYAVSIFRFIYFKVSSYVLAQDLTSETFIRFWKRLQRTDEIENQKALLFVIARGLIVDEYRRKSKRKTISTTVVDERLLSFLDRTEDQLAKKQEIEDILDHLKKLKKEYQEVLLLYYIEDVTIAEIAHILKKKENVVRVLLHRALKSLKGTYE